MPVKMRLQRHGKKGYPFYHIVIADGRAPRDGKFIEKIGTYNPILNPAEINIDFESALNWLQKGAQPTDTVRAILSYKGVIYKNHLLKGVKKGALTEQEAEAKFQAWLSDKEARIEAKRKGLDEKNRTSRKLRLEEESKINQERETELAKKRTAQLEAKAQADREARAAADAANEAANEKAPVADTPAVETTDNKDTKTKDKE